jgi:hypothetical protein
VLEDICPSSRLPAERQESHPDYHPLWRLAPSQNRCIVALPTRFPPPGLRAMLGSAA